MSLPTTAVRRVALALSAGALAACVPVRPGPRTVPTPDSTPATSSARLATRTTLVPAAPDAVGMDPTLGAQLDAIVAAALADSVAPGAAVAVGRWGRLVHLKGYGTLDWRGRPGAGEDGETRVDQTTLYDLASLTKVIATTTVAMTLEEEGRLVLDSTVASYLGPDFVTPDPAKAPITVRQLLTHSGGLEAYAPLYAQLRGREQYLQAIASRPLQYAPGTRAVYSDWDMVLLQLVIEQLTGEPLDRAFDARVASRLRLTETRFTPDATLRVRAAPTAVDTTRGLASPLLKGIVHDGNAWAIGGVSGHAGLFSSARDLAIVAQMLLNGGSYDTVRIVRPQTLARWTAPQGAASSRALGWDTPSGESSAGQYFGPRSFGHTGFTGTSLWIDPERGLFIVLLTNRVHPLGVGNRHVALRRELADAVMRAIVDAPLVSWEPR